MQNSHCPTLRETQKDMENVGKWDWPSTRLQLWTQSRWVHRGPVGLTARQGSPTEPRTSVQALSLHVPCFAGPPSDFTHGVHGECTVSEVKPIL